MKKKRAFLAGMLLISTLGIYTFVSCDKDTYSHLEVSVIDQESKKAVSNAQVVIKMDGGTIADTGYTDEEGIYTTQFAAPAVFDIKAKLFVIDTPIYADEDWLCWRKGESSIRLKEGETVDATVLLETAINHERRQQ